MSQLQGVLSLLWAAVPWQAVGTWVAVVLSLVVFSYLVGDNPLYRFVEHLFVGASVGYAFALAWHSILAPRLRLLFNDPGTYWYYAVFFALGLVLLLRSISSVSWLADIPLALLFGVGAALAIGGALVGSLVPQLQAAVLLISPYRLGSSGTAWARALESLILTVGTVSVLLYFHFSKARKGGAPRVWGAFARFAGGIGKWFIMVAFGALFAYAIVARVALLIDRMGFLLGDWLGIIR